MIKINGVEQAKTASTPAAPAITLLAAPVAVIEKAAQPGPSVLPGIPAASVQTSIPGAGLPPVGLTSGYVQTAPLAEQVKVLESLSKPAEDPKPVPEAKTKPAAQETAKKGAKTGSEKDEIPSLVTESLPRVEVIIQVPGPVPFCTVRITARSDNGLNLADSTAQVTANIHDQIKSHLQQLNVLNLRKGE